MEKVLAGIGIAVLSVFLILVIGVLFAFPTMWLVNYLFTPTALKAVFGTTSLGVVQSWALNIIAGLLFKSSHTSKA